MSRRKRDPKLLREQCSRVAALLTLAPESDAQISRFLGHANPSSLARLRDGESFLDSESLARLGRFEVRAIAHPNLHWVLTGDGEPLLPTSTTKAHELDALCVLARREATQHQKS
ncbi:hypothetical protein [Kinneretia aquatilis]|uniref:hypothetical protein n=1 Tax=Kinneretia aquatilis TaxID=2070761 RepID=UPI00149521EB|nr:hypothetical protein [Paucibacter aquatile]WIV97506.1 hypothetical protein K9V56_021225 [Paucibacter aquatile]